MFMVHPTNNMYHVSPLMFDNTLPKATYSSEQIDNGYVASASASPSQECLMAPYNPQQAQNQRQHQLQYGVAPLIPTSAPSSPQYAIKTEDQSQSSVEYVNMFSQYDLPGSASNQSQDHMISFNRLMPHTTATSMSIPVSSSIMAPMISTAFAPSITATPASFFNQTNFQDDSHSIPTIGYASRPSYTVTAHPAVSKPTTTSTNSRLNKVKSTRSTKVAKPSSSPIPSSEMINYISADVKANGSSPRGARKASKYSINATITESRESSEQPENNANAATDAANRASGAGNVTHPRRAAQNRAAQRTFRNRRKLYIKDLEQKVQDIERSRQHMEAICSQNQEVWKRVQVLEELVARHGIEIPSFSPLIPFCTPGTEFGNAFGLSNNEDVFGRNLFMMGSNDDDDVSDVSDNFLTSHQAL